MPLQYRGGGKRRRGVPGREAATLAAGAIPLYRVFQSLRQRLRDDHRTHQIESQVGHLVGFRFSLGVRHDVTADNVERGGNGRLRRKRPDVLAWRKETAGRRRSGQVRVQLVFNRQRERRGAPANAKDHPGGRTTREPLEVGTRLVDERLESSVLWRRMRRGLLLFRQARRLHSPKVVNAFIERRGVAIGILDRRVRPEEPVKNSATV